MLSVHRFVFLIISVAFAFAAASCSCVDASHDDDDDEDGNDDDTNDDDTNDDDSVEDNREPYLPTFSGWMMGWGWLARVENGSWEPWESISKAEDWDFGDESAYQLYQNPREFLGTIYLPSYSNTIGLFKLDQLTLESLWIADDEETRIDTFGFFDVDSFLLRAGGSAPRPVYRITPDGIETVNLSFDLRAFFQGFNGELYAHDGHAIYEYDGMDFSVGAVMGEALIIHALARGSDVAVVLNDGRFAWREDDAWQFADIPSGISRFWSSPSGVVVFANDTDPEHYVYYRFFAPEVTPISGLAYTYCRGGAGISNDGAMVLMCMFPPYGVSCGADAKSPVGGTVFEIIVAMDGNISCTALDKSFTFTPEAIHIDGSNNQDN